MMIFSSKKSKTLYSGTPPYSGYFLQEPQVSAIERFDCISMLNVILPIKRVRVIYLCSDARTAKKPKTKQNKTKNQK